jgi:hypothetical protein
MRYVKRTVDATWTDPAANCAEESRAAINGSVRPDPLFRMGVNAMGGGWGEETWRRDGRMFLLVVLSSMLSFLQLFFFYL